MDDTIERGFVLFAQNLGNKLGGPRTAARVVGSLYEGAIPSWHRLPEEEKMLWISRANQMAIFPTNPSPSKYKNCSKVRRNRKLEQRRLDFRPLPKDQDDSDDDVGVLVEEEQEAVIDQELKEKYDRDRKMVREAILEQTGGCLDKIKNLRFLLASVQTFGNVDDVCMMAEFAMNEFNLKDGVIDRFSTVVGPWSVENDIQRSRAVFHSNETHRIPLHVNNATFDKRQLVMEILGRCEPSIASQQGLHVGLYTEETEDLEDRLNRLYVGEKNANHLVNGDNRRWVICLRQEYRYMLAGCRHLRDTVGLDYEGFPCTEDRFVLADAFVDALSDTLDGKPVEQFSDWLAALGNHLPEEFATPWERSGELFCARHRHDRNSCCATLTASRSTFIILYSLEDLLKEY